MYKTRLIVHGVVHVLVLFQINAEEQNMYDNDMLIIYAEFVVAIFCFIIYYYSDPPWIFWASLLK